MTTGEDASARSSLERHVQGDTSGRYDRFRDWLANNQEFKTLMLSHQTEARGDEVGVMGGAYKCCELRCKHYVYGFETKEALRRHMGLHEEAEEARQAATLQRRTSNMSLEDEPVDGVKVRDRDAEVSSEEDDKRPLGNGSANANGHGHAPLSPFSKRSALLPTPDPDTKRRGGTGRFSLPALMPPAVRTAGPCLRCKVLKKKCDCQNPCKECPQQDVMAPDLWKALGCFHGPLTELARKCLQGFEPIAITPSPTSSRTHSDSDDVFWAAELDYLMSTSGFPSLDNAFWEDRHRLSINSANIMDMAPDLTDVAYKRLLREYGPAVGLLKTAMLDPVYLGRTAYNPFALLRVGKSAASACRDPSSWQLHTLAQTLLVAVIRYRLALANLRTSPTSPTTPPPTLPSLTTPLTAFLRAFDTRFTNRKELPPSAWLSAFHALCIFSIAKSLLIDTPPFPSSLSTTATTQPHHTHPAVATAARLSTTHKVLVSVFAWSAKLSAWCPKEPLELRDPLLRDWGVDANPAVPAAVREALVDTQRVVGREGWGRAGIKHSKDFLLGLGAGSIEGAGAARFNGFLAARSGGAWEGAYRISAGSGEGTYEPPAQRRRTDSGADTEDVKPTHISDRDTDRDRATSANSRRAPLPHFPPRTSTRSPDPQQRSYRLSSPPPISNRSVDPDAPQASYYRRPTSDVFVAPTSASATPRMPLPNVAVKVVKVEDQVGLVGVGGSGGGGSGGRGGRRGGS